MPAEPPETGSAVSHSGGYGTSSVGVALSGHAIGTPTEPSGYSMATAALYSLSSESGAGTPSSSAVITVAVVCDQNGMYM